MRSVKKKKTREKTYCSYSPKVLRIRPLHRWFLRRRPPSSNVAPPPSVIRLSQPSARASTCCLHWLPAPPSPHLTRDLLLVAPFLVCNPLIRDLAGHRHDLPLPHRPAIHLLLATPPSESPLARRYVVTTTLPEIRLLKLATLAPTPSSTTGVRRRRCCLPPATVRSQQFPDPLSLRLRPCSEPDLLHQKAGLAPDSSATCGSAVLSRPASVALPAVTPDARDSNPRCSTLLSANAQCPTPPPPCDDSAAALCPLLWHHRPRCPSPSLLASLHRSSDADHPPPAADQSAPLVVYFAFGFSFFYVFYFLFFIIFEVLILLYQLEYWELILVLL